LNTITPMGGLEFQRNKIYIGENVAKVYAITKYPQTIDAGWLAKISNIPRAVSCQIFEPCDNSALIEHLSRSVTSYRGIAESSRDALTRQRAEKSADDAENLMRQIDQADGFLTRFLASKNVGRMAKRWATCQILLCQWRKMKPRLTKSAAPSKAPPPPCAAESGLL
jgi:hypothetical protein